MIEPRFLAVLRLIASRLDDSGIDWAITGSLGLALQGLQVEVHDIDLQTDRAGAFEMERRLSEFILRPVAFAPKDRLRSYLGALTIDRIQVEIIGDMQVRLDSGSWEDPVKVRDHLCWADVDGMHLPVLSLEHEYQAYLQMGRPQKARLILERLQRAGTAADPGTSAARPDGEGKAHST